MGRFIGEDPLERAAFSLIGRKRTIFLGRSVGSPKELGEYHPARYKPTRSFLMSNICIGKGSSRKLLKAILRFSVFYLSMYRSTILKPLNSLYQTSMSVV